jgi:glyoxylase-like metal-dependent hydrolase (beta-lactamase superfamily II)
MIIQEPGRVTERITLLGRKESCIYLLDGGSEYAMLGGGMTYVIPDILSQLANLGIDARRISRIIILHAHIDHVGIVSFFKRRWPWLIITASQRARENLLKPKMAKAILDFNTLLLSQAHMAERASEFGLDLENIEVDEVVKEGDIIACGDRTLEIIETPGHSSCSIAVYIREEKALMASDAGGIPFGDQIFTGANSNFDQYQASLEKMARFPALVHMAEHYGAFTGEDARQFLPRSIASAKTTRTLIEESLKRTGDVDQTVAEIAQMLAQEAKGYFLPMEVMTMVLGQMTSYLAKTLV